MDNILSSLCQNVTVKRVNGWLCVLAHPNLFWSKELSVTKQKDTNATTNQPQVRKFALCLDDPRHVIIFIKDWHGHGGNSGQIQNL